MAQKLSGNWRGNILSRFCSGSVVRNYYRERQAGLFQLSGVITGREETQKQANGGTVCLPALKEGPEKDCVGVNYAYWTKRGTWVYLFWPL